MEDFMFEKKEVIIVYDEGAKEYADYLFALISTKKNIEARCLSLKQYEETSVTLSSENNMIFIGDNKITQSKRKFIPEMEFSKYGINYGWLGKTAIAYVEDRKLDEKEYKSFSEYAAKINKKFKEENLNIIDKIPNVFKWMILFLSIWIGGYILYSSSKTQKKIKEQQYAILINTFFMNSLEKFLGE